MQLQHQPQQMIQPLDTKSVQDGLIPFLMFSNGEKVPPDTLDGKLSQLGAKYRKDGRLRERAYFDKWHKHQ